MTSTTTCGGSTTSGSTPPSDTGVRRNSPNKDSSSKKPSNTPLPIHRHPRGRLDASGPGRLRPVGGGLPARVRRRPAAQSRGTAVQREPLAVRRRMAVLQLWERARHRQPHRRQLVLRRRRHLEPLCRRIRHHPRRHPARRHRQLRHARRRHRITGEGGHPGRIRQPAPTPHPARQPLQRGADPRQTDPRRQQRRRKHGRHRSEHGGPAHHPGRLRQPALTPAPGGRDLRRGNLCEGAGHRQWLSRTRRQRGWPRLRRQTRRLP